LLYGKGAPLRLKGVKTENWKFFQISSETVKMVKSAQDEGDIYSEIN
jgi:hypothetical protein